MIRTTHFGRMGGRWVSAMVLFERAVALHCDRCAICNHSTAISHRMSPTLKPTGGGFGRNYGRKGSNDVSQILKRNGTDTGLSCAKEFVSISSAVWAQCTNITVTDGRWCRWIRLRALRSRRRSVTRESSQEHPSRWRHELRRLEARCRRWRPGTVGRGVARRSDELAMTAGRYEDLSRWTVLRGATSVTRSLLPAVTDRYILYRSSHHSHTFA